MKKKYLLAFILFISAFFCFGIEGKGLEYKCEYEINYPFMDNSIETNGDQNSINTYYNYIKHLYAYEYDGNNWLKFFQEYIDNHNTYFNKKVSRAKLTIDISNTNQPIHLQLFDGENNFIRDVISLDLTNIDSSNKCPDLVKVIYTSFEDLKIDTKIFPEENRFQNIDSNIATFYFEIDSDNDSEITMNENVLLFMSKEIEEITGGITYISYSYNQYFAKPNDTQDISPIIEKYLKIDGFKTGLDKINENKDSSNPNADVNAKIILELISKIKDFDVINTELSALNKFNESTITAKGEKYVGLRNILNNYYLNNSYLEIFDIKSSHFYKLFLSNNPTNKVDLLNYYSQYADPLADVLGYIMINKSTIENKIKAEKLSEELETCNTKTNECNSRKKELETLKTEAQNCNGSKDCLLKLCDSKIIYELESDYCKTQTGGNGTAHTACVNSINAEIECKRLINDGITTSDISSRIDNLQKNTYNCDEIKNECMNMCDKDEIDAMKTRFCREQTCGSPNSSTYYDCLNGKTTLNYNAYEACLRGIDAKSYCNSKIENGTTMQDMINNFQEQTKNELEQSIKNYLIQTYEHQGIEIKPKEDWCAILLGKNQENGLYKYINGTLVVITIAGPIIIIVLTALDAIKMIASATDEDNKKFWKHIKIRLICLVILILVPTIINYLVKMFIEGSCEVII